MQHTSMSSDGKLLAVVGDDCDGLLVDGRNGRVSLTATRSYYKMFSLFGCKCKSYFCCQLSEHRNEHKLLLKIYTLMSMFSLRKLLL